VAIRLTGFADEAGTGLADQIRAHQTLGWDTIEMRMVGDVNFTNLDDAAYEAVKAQLAAAKMGVCCFGSAIANWARPITADFGQDVDDLRRAAPRMRELGTSFIRVMSYPNDKDNPLSKPEWFREALRRLRELTRIAESEGVVLAHENCSGCGAESPADMLELLLAINSPAFRMAFDTGNQTAHHGYDNPDLAWEYYQAVRPYIAHVHIKDNNPGPGGEAIHCMPGEGRSQVRRIVKDLVATGYDGFISIEPHIKAQVHLAQSAGKSADSFNMYVEYGRRMAGILAEALAPATPAATPAKPKAAKPAARVRAKAAPARNAKPARKAAKKSARKPAKKAAKKAVKKPAKRAKKAAARKKK
jgi:sugar phosphate isomerase/epimerase